MAELGEDFEGESDGTAMSLANTSFDFLSGSGTLEFDTGVTLNGNPTGLFAATTGQFPYGLWNSTAGSGGSWAGATEVWSRMYFRVSALPSNNTVIHQFREWGTAGSADGTTGCDVRLTSAGKIQLRAPTTARFTSTTTISTDTWYRLEVHVLSNASTGHIEARLYTGANLDGATIDETIGTWSNNYDTGDGTVGGQLSGVGSNPGSTINMSVKHIGISDVGWLGSASTGVSGSGASTLADASSSGAGTFDVPTFTATGASTLADATSAGAGAHIGPIAGFGSSTLGDVTSAGSGAYTPPDITGTGSSTLDDVTSAGAGTSTLPSSSGTGSSTLDAVTSAGSGAYTPPDISGTGASSLADATSTGSGTYTAQPVSASGSSTLADVTSVGVGSYSATAITGTGSITLADITSNGLGYGPNPPTRDPDVASPFQYIVRSHMIEELPEGSMRSGATEQHDRELEDFLGWLYSKVAFRSGGFGPTLGNAAVGTGGSAANMGYWTLSTNQLLVNGRIVFGSSGATFPTAPFTLTLPGDYEFDDVVFDGQAVGTATWSDGGISTDTAIRRASATTVTVVIPGGASMAAGDSVTYQFVARIPLVWERT